MKANDNIKHIIVLITAIIISSIIATKAATTLSSTSVYYDTSKSGGSSSNVNGAIDELYSLTTDREKLKQDIVNIIYPVGSIYMSTEDDTVEKVQDKFGGTWVKYSSGTTLIGDDGTNYITNDSTKGSGGSSTVTLSSKNIPSLSVTGTTNSTGSGYTIGYASTTEKTSTNGSHYHRVGVAGYDGWSSTWVSGYVLRWDQGIFWNQDAGSSTLNYYGSADIHINSSGDHSHTVTDWWANKITGVESHTHTFTGNYTNNSLESINIQNPYTVVYMYKRTA